MTNIDMIRRIATPSVPDQSYYTTIGNVGYTPGQGIPSASAVAPPSAVQQPAATSFDVSGSNLFDDPLPDFKPGFRLRQPQEVAPTIPAQDIGAPAQNPVPTPVPTPAPQPGYTAPDYSTQVPVQPQVPAGPIIDDSVSQYEQDAKRITQRPSVMVR